MTCLDPPAICGVAPSTFQIPFHSGTCSHSRRTHEVSIHLMFNTDLEDFKCKWSVEWFSRLWIQKWGFNCPPIHPQQSPEKGRMSVGLWLGWQPFLQSQLDYSLSWQLLGKPWQTWWESGVWRCEILHDDPKDTQELDLPGWMPPSRSCKSK